MVKANNVVALSSKFYNIEKETLKETFTEEEYESYLDFGIEIGLLTNKILSQIKNKRNVDILKKRINLSDDASSTLEYIGKEYNLTRERTRQIINDICKKFYIYKDDYISIFNKINENILNYLIVGIINVYNINFLKLLLNIVDENASNQILLVINNYIEKSKLHKTKKFNLQLYYQELGDRIYKLVNFPQKINQECYCIFDSLNKERNIFKINNTGHKVLYRFNKNIEYESLMEKDLLYRFSQFNFVKDLKTQSLVIKYEYKGKKYNYYPDVQILTKDNKLIIVEIKPLYNMMEKSVILKYEVLKKYCESNGFGYLMIDERYNTYETAQNHDVDPNLEANFINLIKQKKEINYSDYKLFKEEFHISMKDVVKIVLCNDKILSCSIKPFFIKYIGD